MKAVVCTKYGSPDVLQVQEVETPSPKDHEVLVKIHATTVTAGDTVLRKVTFPRLIVMWPLARFVFGIKKLRKKVLGHEFAGEVETVGKTVTRFKPNDQIFGTTGFSGGAHAEYICLPENGVLALKSSSMTYEEAAALPIGGLVALDLLRKGNIQRNQQVLINGASGSVGTYAVQLAKHFGTEVTGVCSTMNLDLVKSLGADHVIDYTQEDFAASGETYDLVFDAVGKSSAPRSKHVLKPHGRYISTRSSSVRETTEALVFLKELVEAGRLKVVIDRCYPLAQVAEAHQYVETGHKRGNVVVMVAQTS